jgi:hypothetical protein
MKKEIQEQLENEDNWDYDHAETRQPVTSDRVVTSVAFRRDDFRLVTNVAQKLGKKTSEFIREAAIERASGRSRSVIVYYSLNTGVHWVTDSLPSDTQSPVGIIYPPLESPVLSY